MICPIMSARQSEFVSERGFKVVNCQKQDCAWYVEGKSAERCVIFAIHDILRDVFIMQRGRE